MGNVLGNLFSDIAIAIRVKTGESGTMKPAQFPAKIMGIQQSADSAAFDSILDEINGEVVGELVVSSGSCGTSASYMLNDGGTLKITGSGQITSAPWRNYEDDILRLVISDGITTIPQNAFVSCGKLASVTMGSGLTEIGIGAFNSCESLPSLTIPASMQVIQAMAIANCTSLARLRFEKTEGWKIYKNTGELVKTLSSSDLADPVAAAALMKTYCGEAWKNV